MTVPPAYAGGVWRIRRHLFLYGQNQNDGRLGWWDKFPCIKKTTQTPIRVEWWKILIHNRYRWNTDRMIVPFSMLIFPLRYILLHVLIVNFAWYPSCHNLFFMFFTGLLLKSPIALLLIFFLSDFVNLVVFILLFLYFMVAQPYKSEVLFLFWSMLNIYMDIEVNTLLSEKDPWSESGMTIYWSGCKILCHCVTSVRFARLKTFRRGEPRWWNQFFDTHHWSWLERWHLLYSYFVQAYPQFAHQR